MLLIATGSRLSSALLTGHTGHAGHQRQGGGLGPQGPGVCVLLRPRGARHPGHALRALPVRGPDPDCPALQGCGRVSVERCIADQGLCASEPARFSPAELEPRCAGAFQSLCSTSRPASRAASSRQAPAASCWLRHAACEACAALVMPRGPEHSLLCAAGHAGRLNVGLRDHSVQCI